MKKFILEAALICDKGKIREENEDNFCFDGELSEECQSGERQVRAERFSTGKQRLFGVFDGMGGYARGQRASFLAAREAAQAAGGTGKEPGEAEALLKELCARANESVCREMERERLRMGTTASMLLFCGEEVWVCNVGDSPVFRYRDGRLETLYREHTERRLFEELYGSGRAYGRKFPLTQHIGIRPEEMVLQPHLQKEEVSPGDLYLICSDGLSDMVCRERIGRILGASATSAEAAGRLAEEALQNGGRDNITVLCIKAAKRRRQIGAKMRFGLTEKRKVGWNKWQKE